MLQTKKDLWFHGQKVENCDGFKQIYDQEIFENEEFLQKELREKKGIFFNMSVSHNEISPAKIKDEKDDESSCES